MFLIKYIYIHIWFVVCCVALVLLHFDIIVTPVDDNMKLISPPLIHIVSSLLFLMAEFSVQGRFGELCICKQRYDTYAQKVFVRKFSSTEINKKVFCFLYYPVFFVDIFSCNKRGCKFIIFLHCP